MPVELVDPADDGPIKIYAGDPKTIRLRLEGVNSTGRTYASQIRRRAADSEILAVFNVTVTQDGPDTVVELHLPGDSAPGAMDGRTRAIENTARMDVQEWVGGRASRTIAAATLQRVQDVTR